MQGPTLITGAAGFVGSHLIDLLGGDIVAWYRPGARGSLKPDDPTPLDLQMPSRLKPLLDGFVARWVPSGAAPAERMAARLKAAGFKVE